MLDIEKNLGVSNFTIVVLEVSLKLEMHISLRILNLMGENKFKNTNFKEEHNDSVNAEDNLILSYVQENLILSNAEENLLLIFKLHILKNNCH